MCDWHLFREAPDKFHNTPTSWSIYVTGLNVRHMLQKGGIPYYEKLAQDRSKLIYNIIGLLRLIDRLLQLHQLPLLLANKGHPLLDLPRQLPHTRINRPQIITIDIVLAAHLLPLNLQPLDVSIKDRILFLNFWKTGCVEP